MQLERILQQQGFGVRKACRALVRQGRVTVAGKAAKDPEAEFDLTGSGFAVDGVFWPYHARATLLLNKPAGVECSRRPRHYPGVLSLLPPQCAARGMQSVGRLDVDTTGLLLLSDDGQLIHALASPRRKVRKTYRATVRHPLDEAQLAALRAGVTLHDDPAPVAAVKAIAEDAHTLTLILTSGRYHQVKRMVAAAGNRVEKLCRIAVGGLVLPGDVPEGTWCWLTQADLEKLWEEEKTS
ncbi:MAG: 16S rRNA pseudouridine(516) synthase [Zoogloeaceae bacterium]|jgi:16S rRNA pseudouridine516 synthase|nr:16S rRNA pseudouridine(516) synthase [Zoogloeaceae bacterium]